MDAGRKEISGYNVEELGCGFASFADGLTMDVLESWAIYARPFPGSMIAGSKGGICLSPFSFHTAIEDMQIDTTFDLGSMNYLNHTVYAENSVYDTSQVHWIASLQGKCELLPTALIGLNTQQIQEGIYLSNKYNREMTADEITELSQSKALEVPNL